MPPVFVHGGKLLKTAGGRLVGSAAVANQPLQGNLATLEYFDVTPVFADLIYQGFGFMVHGTTTPIAVNPADGAPNQSNVEVVIQYLPALTADIDLTFRVYGNFTSTAIRSGQAGDAITSNGTYSGGFREITVHMTSGRVSDTLRLQLTGCTRASDSTAGFDNIICPRPGYTVAQILAGTRFTTEYLALIAPLKCLRFMDWLQINGAQNFGQGADFTKRATRTQRRTTYSYSEDATGATAKRIGCCFEDIIDLMNLTGKDGWVPTPILADNTWVTSYITLMHAGLNSSLALVDEVCNENWNTNGGFEQFNKVLDAVSTELGGVADVSDRFGQLTRYLVSANRTSNVITLIFSVNLSLTANGSNSVTIANLDGDGNNTSYVIQSVPAADRITINKTGSNGAVSANSGFSLVDNNTSSDLVTSSVKNCFTAMALYVLRREKQKSDLIRAVVGDANMHTRYRPVFCWWSIISDFDAYIAWLDAVYGGTHRPAYYLYGIGHAPYYSLDATPLGGSNLASDSSAGTVVSDYTTAAGLAAKYSKVRYGIEAKAVTCLHYPDDSGARRLELLCYEGGSDFATLDGDLADGSANNAKKSAANADAAIKQPHKDYLSDQILYGTDNTMPSQYFVGVGSTTSTLKVDRFWDVSAIGSLTDGKHLALTELAAAARQQPTRHVGLGSFDGRLRAGQYVDIDPNLTTSGTYPWWVTADMSSHSSIDFIWYETAATAQTRTFAFDYTCNFAGWQFHVDINGTRIATAQALSASPADLTTVKSVGPFTFTSRPGRNGVRMVKAAGGSGRDGQIRLKVFA